MTDNKEDHWSLEDLAAESPAGSAIVSREIKSLMLGETYKARP